MGSLDVNVKAIDESLLVSPSETVELAIIMLGEAVSMTKSGIVNELELPAASVTVTVSPLYVPSSSELKVIVLLPEDAEDVVEKPSLTLEVIVPASSLLNTKLGVVSLPGVATAVTAASVGAVES